MVGDDGDNEGGGDDGDDGEDEGGGDDGEDEGMVVVCECVCV